MTARLAPAVASSSPTEPAEEFDPVKTEPELPELEWFLEFEQAAASASEHFISRVLPSMLDAFHLGGTNLIGRMAESARRRRLPAGTTTRAASPKAVRLARNVFSNCPVGIESHPPEGEEATLGELVESLRPDGVHRSSICLYASAFADAGLTGERLMEELYWTVFSEYAHFFQAQLSRQYQVRPANALQSWSAWWLGL